MDLLNYATKIIRWCPLSMAVLAVVISIIQYIFGPTSNPILFYYITGRLVYLPLFVVLIALSIDLKYCAAHRLIIYYFSISFFFAPVNNIIAYFDLPREFFWFYAVSCILAFTYILIYYLKKRF